MIKRITVIALLTAMTLPVAALAAGNAQKSGDDADASAALNESSGQTEEVGYVELEKLMSTCDSMDIEGMSFEDISDAYIDNALVEYFDGNTGFSVLYPALLSKQLEGGSTGFTSEDGKATILIEAIPADKALSVKNLEESIRTGDPGAKTAFDEETGCFRSDSVQGDDTVVMDLYLSAEKWLHHVRYSYPKAQEDIYGLYKDFIMNSMKTDELALG